MNRHKLLTIAVVGWLGMMLTTLSSDLARNFDIDISFVWDRTQKPPPLADGTFPEQDDYRLLVGISYEF